MHIKTLSQTIVLIFVVSLLSACAINDKQQLNKFLDSSRHALSAMNNKPLSDQDIAAGLKEALRVGTERVISRVGKTNGYLNDKAIHIVLPKKLQKVHNTLEKVGLGKYTDELEVKMNHAAEVAASKARQLFWKAITEMTWQDVKAIYKGNDNAATVHFRSKMTPELKQMMRPVISNALAQVGAVKAYKHVVNEYHKIPFVPRVDNDLTGYVMNKGIHGMFFYLEKEEAAIRKDPVKRTTELLKRVFGS